MKFPSLFRLADAGIRKMKNPPAERGWTFAGGLGMDVGLVHVCDFVFVSLFYFKNFQEVSA